MAKAKVFDAVKCPVCQKMNEVSDEGAWFYKSRVTDSTGYLEYNYYCDCGCEYNHYQKFEVVSTSTDIDHDPRDLDELESEDEENS